jgi:SPP1 gp7 family putative phage head morphogenesis protein
MLQSHAKAGAKAAADRLVTAVALGENPRKIAGAIRADLQTETWKALRIARTEIIRAHTAGAIGQMRQHADITPSYEWNARGDACLACQANHGRVFPISDVPARHPNCRCVMLPVVIDPTTGKPLSQPIETGQDRIDRMSMDDAADLYGQRRAELLKAPGKARVPLADMQTIRPSEVWGDTVAIVPLRDLVRA